MEDWLDPVYDAAGMGAADRWAIDGQGVPSLELMEAAGRALADVTAELAVPGPVRVVCGKGNNGGDGLVAARHLASSGFEVDVILLWPSDELSPDSTANFERLEGIEVLEGEGALSQISSSGAVIDAVLGTGFSGEPREPVLSAIEAINGSGAPVIACDVPSGSMPPPERRSHRSAPMRRSPSTESRPVTSSIPPKDSAARSMSPRSASRPGRRREMRPG